jgi:hypothetical protein
MEAGQEKTEATIRAGKGNKWGCINHHMARLDQIERSVSKWMWHLDIEI